MDVLLRALESFQLSSTAPIPSKHRISMKAFLIQSKNDRERPTNASLCRCTGFTVAMTCVVNSNNLVRSWSQEKFKDLLAQAVRIVPKRKYVYQPGTVMIRLFTSKTNVKKGKRVTRVVNCCCWNACKKIWWTVLLWCYRFFGVVLWQKKKIRWPSRKLTTNMFLESFLTDRTKQIMPPHLEVNPNNFNTFSTAVIHEQL